MGIIETINNNDKQFFIKSNILPIEIFVLEFLIQEPILKSYNTIIKLLFSCTFHQSKENPPRNNNHPQN